MKAKSNLEPSAEIGDPTLSGLSLEQIEEIQSREAADRFSRLYRIGNEPLRHFSSVIEAIAEAGLIPMDEQECIAQRAIGAAHIYKFRSVVEEAELPPARRRKLYKDIGVCSAPLLKLLGVKDPKLIAYAWPTAKGRAGRRQRAKPAGSPQTLPWQITLMLPDLQRVAVERRGYAVTLDALGRGITLMQLLSDSAEAAARTARKLAPQAPMGRGGKRREGQSAEGELIHKILDIYAEVRERHPNSGPKPGYGGPLLRFVRACLRVFDLGMEKRMTDTMIRGHFTRWRAERGQPG